MKRKYIITISYHHNNKRNPWHQNITASNYKEALLIAFNTAIQSEFYDIKLDVELLRPILNKTEHTFTIEDEYEEKYDIFIWNEIDEYGHKNIGLGFGKKVSDTNKYDNSWITVELRKNTKASLIDSIKGYSLMSLSVKKLQQILKLIEVK